MQIEDIEKLISPKTKMIIVNSPNNPTGSVLSRESLEKIARIAKDNDLIVLSDEIYEKLLYDDSKHTSIASLPEMAMRTIIINGVSKAYAMTGWRIGFAASKNPDFISAMIRVLQYTVTCATSVSQYAAEAALNGPTGMYRRDARSVRRKKKAGIQIHQRNRRPQLQLPEGRLLLFHERQSPGHH